MKLLCDVCENAVASLVCCADEAVLCSSCDSRVHAANKLASKHHRVALVPETSEPAVCDICQERPSFFFCLEDRALLCRECDLSVHSANALTAKHRRFLLTGITVGMSLTAGTIQETCSALASDKHTPVTFPTDNAELSMEKQVMQDIAMSVEKCSRDNGAVMRTKANEIKLPSSPQIACSKSSPTPPPIDVTSLRSYTMTKDGTLSMASKTYTTTDHRSEVEPTSITKPNSTTISIQRISAGQRAPFVAPVLSSIRSSLSREEAPSNGYIKNGSISNSRYSNTDNFSTNESVMMDVDASSPVEDDIVSDYLNSGIPGWRLDELLTDLVGACDSGRSLSPPKESNVPGFGLQEEHSWFAELDFMEEQELSPSQQESVALVPEMPSPPTHSGLGVPRGKSTCPAAQPWAYDYLFTGPDHLNEFSVVPDVNVGGQRSLPDSPTLPVRGASLNKKRKFW